MPDNPTSLSALLPRQIARLERRIGALQSLSRRYSWYRLGVILVAGFLTWAVSTRWGAGWGWLAFFLAAALFTALVVCHRRVNGWLHKFIIWTEIKRGYLARLELDWEAIPQPELPAGRVKSPLEIDLDLTGPSSLHHLLDLSISREGSELLARWLGQAVPDLGEIAARQQVVRELAPLDRFRDRLLLAFRLVSAEQLRGERLLAWLAEPFPSGRLNFLLPVAALFVALNFVLFWLHSLGWLPAFWIISLSLYLVFYLANAGPLNRFLAAIVQLDEELDKFRAILHYLEKYPYRGQPHLAELCRPFTDPQTLPSRQLRKVKLVTAAVGLRMNFVLGLLLNLIFPWDFTFAFLANRYRAETGRSLALWLETWYRLEALVSLAGFAHLHSECTFPEITSEAAPVLQAAGLGHPLIPAGQKVRNDFTIPALGAIALITGSNMAGKSTFIKTVGINLCLAYAGGPVDAVRFRSLPFRLHTCIRISDSITAGYSYFYAEVKCLRRLMDELGSTDSLPVLYLIDEIFRGTNNRERLIGSRAYLRALAGAPGAGLLATHDLELASLSAGYPQVTNYHFRDHVLAGRLAFDYRLRPGPSPTTNALKIMEMEGLPVD